MTVIAAQGEAGYTDLVFTLNDSQVEVSVRAGDLLVDVLRHDFGLTGTKSSCRVGVCGACSVLLDGHVVSACLTPAVLAGDREVWTIEGLSRDHPLMAILQEAFVRCGAFQCGYCTPGQLVAAYALLDEHGEPSRSEVREWMEGNLCRCTGYTAVDDAILLASRRRGARSEADGP